MTSLVAKPDGRIINQRMLAVLGDSAWKIAIVKYLCHYQYDLPISVIQSVMGPMSSSEFQVWFGKQVGYNVHGQIPHEKAQKLEQIFGKQFEENPTKAIDDLVAALARTLSKVDFATYAQSHWEAAIDSTCNIDQSWVYVETVEPYKPQWQANRGDIQGYGDTKLAAKLAALFSEHFV